MLTGLINLTCDIETRQQAKSATGGTNITWLPRATAVRCGLKQLSAQAILAFGALGYKADTRFYFDSDESLTIKDRIVFNGFGYEVRAVNNVAGYSRLWQVDAERKPYA